MRKEDKATVIEQITATLKEYTHVYLTETTALNAEKTSNLRRECYKNDIKLLVVKNTLLKKAMESLDTDYSSLFGSLKGSTTLMLSNTQLGFKAAYVEESFYGADQLDALVAIKSKNELIADVIALLQSPVKNVVSALQSGGSTLHGVLQTLSER